MRTTITITAAAVAAVLAAGCGSVTAGSGGQADRTVSQPPAAATQPPAPADTAPATPAPAVPNPDGTYQGSCDYILGSDPVGGFGPGTARAVGEIDLRNTGNIGTVIRAKITWPQEGSPPIAATKTVRTRAGQHKVVRFSVPINGDQVDLLQSWQDRHNYADGCTYRAAMVDTFGQAH